MYNIHSAESTAPPIWVTLKVHQKPIRFEVDTGAAVSVISEATYKSAFPTVTLSKSEVLLKTYTGELISILGELKGLSVCYGDQTVEGLSLIVAKGSGTSLLGRNWLREVRLDWKDIRAVTCQEYLKPLLQQYHDVFQKVWEALTDSRRSSM